MKMTDALRERDRRKFATIGGSPRVPPLVALCALCSLTLLMRPGMSKAEGGGGENDARRTAEEIVSRLHPGHLALGDPVIIRDRKYLRARGEAIFPGCIYILEHDAGRYEINAVLALIREMEADVSPLLPSVRKLLLNKDECVRWDAIRFLESFGTDEDVAGLVGMLDDEREIVRGSAAGALGR